MKIKIAAIAVTTALLIASAANALNSNGKRFTSRLTNRDLSVVMDGAKEVLYDGTSDQEVLDVVAEVLAQGFKQNQDSESHADVMGMLCEVLGLTKNGRYKKLLAEVADDGKNKRVRRQCDKAADKLPKKVTPYKVGSVNLDDYRYVPGTVTTVTEAAAAAAADPDAAQKPARPKADLSLITKNMTQEQVEKLIGPPDNYDRRGQRHSNQSWARRYNPNPMQDNGKYLGLYRGVGRVVYLMNNKYNGMLTVKEVIKDPGESGYP